MDQNIQHIGNIQVTRISSLPRSSSLFYPLFGYTRSNNLEVEIQGFASLKLGNDFVTSSDATIVTRSLFKPWQALACSEHTDHDLWAIAISSHSGQEMHTQALQFLSDQEGIPISELYCPATFPMDSDEAEKLRRANIGPAKIYHPCAGKHLAILSYCKKKGENTDYWNLTHPYHQRLSELLANWTNGNYSFVTDSCGLPTLVVEINQFVDMWQQLSLRTEPRVKNLINLWRKNPLLTGGINRLDSEIMTQFPNIIAKEGADGLIAVQSFPSKLEPASTCVLKLAPGYNKNQLALGLLSILSRNRQSLTLSFQKLLEYLERNVEQFKPKDQDIVLFS